MDIDGRKFPKCPPGAINAGLLSALLATVLPCLADIPSGWSTNLTATLKAAETNNRPVLLYFTASWCGPCKLMQANTLPDPAVRSNLAHFACVALDLDANQATAQHHGVSAIPAFLILTESGDEVLRTEGYQDATQFNKWLAQAKIAFTTAQEKVAAFLKQQATLGVNLKSADAATRQAALTGLFNLCADREPSHQAYATAQLKALAAGNPKVLVAGLEHPKLATRIAVANQLREALGTDLAFDPWASPADRASAVLALKNSSSWDANPKKIEAEKQE